MHVRFIKFFACRGAICIPYAAKLLRGKTFAVVRKIHKNFHGVSGLGHRALYTATDSRGKLLRSAEKPQKFSPSKVFPYTVRYDNIKLKLNNKLMISLIIILQLYYENSVFLAVWCSGIYCM